MLIILGTWIILFWIGFGVLVKDVQSTVNSLQPVKIQTPNELQLMKSNPRLSGNTALVSSRDFGLTGTVLSISIVATIIGGLLFVLTGKTAPYSSDGY